MVWFFPVGIFEAFSCLLAFSFVFFEYRCISGFQLYVLIKCCTCVTVHFQSLLIYSLKWLAVVAKRHTVQIYLQVSVM